MNKFDELLMLNEKLDAVLDDMKKANKHLENELKAKHDAAQEQLFNDVGTIRSYMKKVGMDNVDLYTGINPTDKERDKSRVLVVKISTLTTDIGLMTVDIKRPTDYTFHRWFEKNVPIAKAEMSWTTEYSRDFMLKLMRNWDVAYENMQNDLFDKMNDFMAEKASQVTKRQSELVNQLDDFCRKDD